MASSGNFCTYNRLPYSTQFRVGLGNLYNGVRTAGNTLSNPGQNCTGFGTMALTTGKKWYMEGIATNAYNTTMGIFELNDANLIQNSLNTTYYSNTSYKSAFYHRDGNKYIDGSSSSYGATFTTGDIIGMAVDLESATNTIEFFKNNSSQGSFNLGTNGLNYLFCVSRGTSGGAFHMNWGQDSTFAGTKTAGGNADANGFGDFYYAPPSGYLALCSANLPISDDIDPAQTDDDYPQKQFNVLTYTGNGSTRSITGLGFKPDCIFLKARNYASVQQVYDSTRGGTKQLYPSQTGSEATYSNMITSFDNDGWSMGDGNSDINYSSRTFVTWCFRANGGVTSSNTDGSITSTVQANTKAGFSIVSYTGNATNGATFGHGLSAKPSLVFIKNRGAIQKWAVWHQSMEQNDNKLLFLSENSALTTEGTQRWDVSAISDSVFGLGSHPEINGSSANYISYIWHDVEGYSKFGSYIGNGNADGPFIYTGFRPRFLFIKGVDNASNWEMRDTERDTFNPLDTTLLWDDPSAEVSSSASNAYPMDVLSNGFKIRTTSGNYNTSGNTYVYGAWGDVPFKYNNTF